MNLFDLAPVIPVVVVHDAEVAVPLAEALLAGGLPVIEVTLRTPAALEAIERIAAAVPDAMVGAGTIVSAGQVGEAVSAGAGFLVSPGCTDRLAGAMAGSGLPFLPGVATASEVIAMLGRGVTAMKFFPAEASGGVGFLKSVAGPLPDARFCPTGGITPQNAPDYLALPNVGCVGGSWLTPADVVADRDWTRVSELAKAAARVRP